MKKILTLLLALSMLFILTACGCSKEDTDNTTPTTEGVHTHSYSSTEKAATCTEKGLETFTCSCGHTYTEELPATGHTWGDWETETPALVGKDGTEKQTCSVCSASETRTTTDDAASNSFADDELQYVFCADGNMTAYGMLSYFSQKYEGREEDLLVVSSDTVFEWLSARFVLTDALKEEMKQVQDASLQYFAETDTFELSLVGSYGEMELLGYISKGDNSYAAYYQFSSREGTGQNDGVWEVTVEYNLLNGQPNRYLSVAKVDRIPDKVIN